MTARETRTQLEQEVAGLELAIHNENILKGAV